MLTLYASRLRLDLDIPWRRTRAALRAAFAPCWRPLLSPTERVEIAVDERLQVRCDGLAVTEAAGPGDLLPVVEHLLYQVILAHCRPALALHAAALVAPAGAPLLLLGASGAGKSTLARALVRAGWSYLGDDLAFFDGTRLWGLPRTIQFNPIALDETPAPLLVGCDLSSCLYHAADGRTVALPLAPVAEERVARGPAPAAAARLILLTSPDATVHAPTAEGAVLEPCAPLAALAALHEATLAPLADLRAQLGALIHPARCHRLAWRDAAHAAALLAGLDPPPP